ncbi:MAG TPA: response regulator, partial [Verrucomicrobiae bacterium]|nr:response regulator [Verrucomicrobiae bacterium]
MKKILFVEDDALVARIYSRKLAEEGFEVAVAEDGLAALRRLPEFRPDVMVLDLMMPKLTGADVLKFVRQHPQLKSTRVVVFSNSFLSDLVEQVTALGVEEALIKASVTPARLVEVINRVLAGPGFAGGATGSPIPLPVKPQKAERTTEPQAAPPEAERPTVQSPPPGRIQREFLEHTAQIFKGIRELCRGFFEATDPADQVRRSEDLRRKIGFLTQMTGIAGYRGIAELCSALEALLYELKDRPPAITDSCRHTIA